MTRDWKYILYLSFAIGAFVLLKLLSPKQFNWTVTYAAEDKIPFGGYALNTLLRSEFSGGMFHSFKTLYELKDSIRTNSNLLIFAETFSPGDDDALALLDHVHQGGNAVISAQYMYGLLADTLKLSTGYKFSALMDGADSAKLRFVAAAMDTSKFYAFKEGHIQQYISHFDTTRTAVIAVNEYQAPVTIRMKWGQGNLIINSTPFMFTNIYILAGDNADFVSAHFSYLPDAALTWTEYYQRGRREISTPLRFILLNEPLRWAYYISLISLIFFMVFEMKRRQRIIPVIPPLTNTTLEFVSTIGDLYYQTADHKNIAEKKINYFLEHVRSKYGVATNQLDPNFAATLARKSGQDGKEVDELIQLIRETKDSQALTADGLVDLNLKLEAFYSKK